ncbi:hypothetical protein PTKIN_Ptkin18bG0032200 [Pterospermum kingtungense]
MQMQDWVSSGGSEMVSHTLTGHQEILQDLTEEFYRLHSSVRAKQEHASLIFRSLVGLDLTWKMLLVLQNKLYLRSMQPSAEVQDRELRDERLTRLRMDSVISQAQTTLSALVLQHSTFGGINSKLSNIVSLLPTIDNFRKSLNLNRKPFDRWSIIYWLSYTNEWLRLMLSMELRGVMFITEECLMGVGLQEEKDEGKKMVEMGVHRFEE